MPLQFMGEDRIIRESLLTMPVQKQDHPRGRLVACRREYVRWLASDRNAFPAPVGVTRQDIHS